MPIQSDRVIVPHKMILSYAEDGTVKDAILQYRIKVNGVMDNKFYTMGVKESVSKTAVDSMAIAKAQVDQIEQATPKTEINSEAPL